MYSKILVSVVNYCDPEFYSTIVSLWKNAKNKEKLFFSLVSEDSVFHDFSFIPQNQIRYLHYDLSEYRGGLGWARNLAVDIDLEYDYFIQFDSHTLASFGWDDLAYKRYTAINDDDKFIIAYAPAAYEILNTGVADLNVDNTVSKCAQYYENVIPGFKFPGYKILELDEVVVSYWATCCYLFAPRSWVKEVGIGKDESFNTEEISLSLRTFAAGWKIYSIGTRDVFHHESHRQANGVITRQTLRPWADERRDSYWAHVEKSTDKLSLLLSGLLDIDKAHVIEFCKKTGLSEKYLEFIPNYSSHIIVENRGFGMPPRRDI